MDKRGEDKRKLSGPYSYFSCTQPPQATPRPALDGPSKERSGQVHITRLQRAQEGKLKRTKMELDGQNESKTLLESDLRDGKPHHKTSRVNHQY